ncbi:Acb2/Tad1 domain-containing protein [Pararhizobium qamdonense]|uniref:Acb2/Tad1 domain-containing protein n=1 Tax=Pararhizobium qamdonense TaxID=3031126 RepID=UPI0023E26A0F|nr:hypothetical protein [Pararhizobium qamdonense]
MTDTKAPSPPFGFPLEGLPIAGDLSLHDAPKKRTHDELNAISITTDKLPFGKIEPGEILISGTTTLADWRSGSDTTAIDGGKIETAAIRPGRVIVDGPIKRDMLLVDPPIVVERHTGLPVKGYTPQSEENVALVNRAKELEERVLRQVDKIKAAGGQYDQRFVAMALSHLQVGFMLLYRGVFQPERINLPEDEA